MSTIGATEIRKVLRSELSTILDNEELPDLTDDMRLLTELGLDSTGVVELLLALEDSLGLPLEPDDLTPEVFETVGSLSAFISAGLAARGGEG